MPDQIVYLKLPERPPSVVSSPVPGVTLGRQYQLGIDELHEELHGICGGQDYCIHHGRVLPVSASHCYFWDIDEELTAAELQFGPAAGEVITLTATSKICTSGFVLSHSALSEPQIKAQESSPQLTTTASFQFAFGTELNAVQLGLLSLVETQRFALLRDGERYTLLESSEGQPVLYLPDVEHNNVLTPILETNREAGNIQHSHEIMLTQAIPERLAESEVETVTVLEQYTSYFMQRELPCAPDNIWTPVCAPITWGWSMRVAKRRDGDWGIVRQKLLMPTAGHNGLEMPVWEGNQSGR